MSLPGPATPVWRIIGASVRGASHVRDARPNQDAIASRTLPRATLLALADGHGSARYLRSHQGAKLAVQTALDELERFIASEPDPTYIKRRAEEELPRSLVRAWQARVDTKLADSPLTSDEQTALHNLMSSSELDKLQEQPQRLFGATLLACAVTPDFGLFLQLGDGDIVTVDASHTAVRLPLEDDARLIANQTTSLAGRQAWQDMRVYFQPFVNAPPTLILFATDGYANSFADARGFLDAASDFAVLLREKGHAYVQRNLTQWLSQTSQLGSGDDITVGLLTQLPPSP